jgi:hypothetical protein
VPAATRGNQAAHERGDTGYRELLIAFNDASLELSLLRQELVDVERRGVEAFFFLGTLVATISRVEFDASHSQVVLEGTIFSFESDLLELVYDLIFGEPFDCDSFGKVEILGVFSPDTWSGERVNL